MKIAHVITGAEEKLSGAKNSVTLFVKYLGKKSKTENVIYSANGSKPFLFNGKEILPVSALILEDYDLIILNGIYDFTLMKLAGVAASKNIKYVFFPRSSLMVNSLAKSWYKKIPFLLIYSLNFYWASGIFFLSEEEKKRSFFGTLKKSFVCGNIVDTVPFGIQENRKKIIRFIGRFDINHKGLDVLLGAVSLASKDIRDSGWSVCLHGPDQANELEILKSIASRSGIEDIVSFHDAVFQEEKFRLLSESSFFVHTSRYEGQPQAVMEAMAYGNAILITPGTNMTSIIRNANCGITCDFNKAKVAEGILKLIRMPHDQLQSMQFNAFEYAKKNFAGESVANCFVQSLCSLGLERHS